MSTAIHVAVTRQVRPGCEAEFQEALREFFQTSFAHTGVRGASMLVPPPGTKSPEFGILRSFNSRQDRDAFYNSPMFLAWEERIKPLVEGEAEHRELTGLEAWFRTPQNPPPKWKMVLLTWIGVWPISMAVPAALGPLLGRSLPPVLFAGAVAGGIVLVLTWIGMPLLIKLTNAWLHPKNNNQNQS